MKKTICILLGTLSIQVLALTAHQYTNRNKGIVSYDVSMPIDATGYRLKGQHLKGGTVVFSDKGHYFASRLARETGTFNLPTVRNQSNKPLIKTNVKYDVIKLIAPIGIANSFIKVGFSTRTQTFNSLDPFVIKNGTYVYHVPLFSFGNESDNADTSTSNFQFLQVGGVGKDNAMYTQQFYLYLNGKGSGKIHGHPIRTSRENAILQKPLDAKFKGYTLATWDVGDPVTTKNGHGGPSKGMITTLPGAPYLDYEYGTFELPKVHTPWTATKKDHCTLRGKYQAGCVDATIGASVRFMAQKIRVPLNKEITLFASFGQAYRRMKPNNIRYVLKSNIYLKNLITAKQNLKESYLPGGTLETYFAVGFDYKAKDNKTYTIRYAFIPGRENADMFAWRDAPTTQMFLIGVDDPDVSNLSIKKNLNQALKRLKLFPEVDAVLSTQFFKPILQKNGYLTK